MVHEGERPAIEDDGLSPFGKRRNRANLSKIQVN